MAKREGLGAFKEKNVSISQEFAECQVGCGMSGNRQSQLSMLRGKISKHLSSRAHQLAENMNNSRKKNTNSRSFQKFD